MDAIKAIVQGGRLDVTVRTDWPDGTEVVVQPLAREQMFGIREEDWPETPEARAEWLRWYDSLEPLIFTPAEEAAWAAARRNRRSLIAWASSVKPRRSGKSGNETLPSRHRHHGGLHQSPPRGCRQDSRCAATWGPYRNVHFGGRGALLRGGVQRLRGTRTFLGYTGRWLALFAGRSTAMRPRSTVDLRRLCGAPGAPCKAWTS